MDRENIMLENIMEEPGIIRGLIENRKEIARDFVNHFEKYPVKRVYFSGHGSPYHVGMIIKPMMENLLKVEVSAEIPTLFNNHSNFNVNGVYQPEEMLLICPAQSGRTSGPYYSAEKAHNQGIPIMCITLRGNGMLAKISDILVVKPSGDETAFPETKGHLASVAILMLCILEAAFSLKRISDKEYEGYIEAFSRIPKACEEAIAATISWHDKYKYYLLRENTAIIVGYGSNYGTALEGALKVLESTLKLWTGYECEEFMHGKNQPVGHNSVLFFLYVPDKGTEPGRMKALVEWCRERSEACFVLGTLGCDLEDEKALCWNAVNYPYISALEYHIPFQMLSYLLARDLGRSTVVAEHDTVETELKLRIEE